MAIDYTTLRSAARLLMEAELKPLQGNRFQPTGFADLGAARYTVPSADGASSVEMLLVESAQSVANRMELACWDEANDTLIPELKGLPYVVVKAGDGKEITNSFLEAHRINSEYIMKSGGKPSAFSVQFAEEIGYAADAPVQWHRFHEALFKYDVNSLIHGCFLEEIAGRLRVTRALSGFIEARNIAPAESGGVKNNHVQPGLKSGEGNVPFPRTEFVAERITCYFNLDLALLRGYGLGQHATDVLVALALFKVRRFLSTGLRLRTACDLELVGELAVKRPDGFAVPPESELLDECSRLIGVCADQFAGMTSMQWEPKKKTAKDAKDKPTDADDDSDPKE